ncbi:MAG: DNA polymerase III subunit delta [Firmicutes bacterium]|nr:DNA polymerase III subunit delta [Bacillota bacterium]
MSSLKEDIKSKQFKKCYLLFGEDQFLMAKAQKDLENAVVDEMAAVMNRDFFDGASDIGKVMDAAETMPFLSDMRLVVVKDSGLFDDGRSRDTEKMAEYIANIPDSTCILFAEKKVKKNNRLYKAVAKVGTAEEFGKLTEGEAAKVIAAILKREKINCSSALVYYIIHSVGCDMASLEKEVTKLIAYKGEGGTVEQEDIDAVCTKTLEAKVFDMVKAIGMRNPSQAIKIYRTLIMFNEAPIKIFALVIRQFKIMLQCKVLSSEGKNLNEIKEITGQNYYAVKECTEQSRNFTAEALKNAVYECLETDTAIKSGKIDAEAAVELIIAKYSM